MRNTKPSASGPLAVVTPRGCRAVSLGATVCAAARRAHPRITIPNMTTLVTQLFRKGDPVPVSGIYVCVPCGFIQYFTAGTLFKECLACLAGTLDGPEGYRENEQEFWQFIG